jgi:beta-glucosidase/6-phospho-beta-glucosidase/beta-galactosidase
LRRREVRHGHAFGLIAGNGTMKRTECSSVVTQMLLFRSFWMTGFDGADHMEKVDATDGSQYWWRVEADYRAVRDAGIACVRESIDWRRASRGDGFDFSTVALRANCARRAGLQIVWTLCHAGGPGDLDVRSSAFVDRFVAFAYGRALRDVQARIGPLLADPQRGRAP